MSTRPAIGPAVAIALGSVIAMAGCVELEATDEAALVATCADSSAYTPYTSSAHPSGDVTQWPWRGEAFAEYAPLPAVVECSSGKGKRDHLEVTAGCLEAVALGAVAYTRGLVTPTTSGAFRALALGRATAGAPPVKWFDQRIEYRFHHQGASGIGASPGFKAFVRYRSEDDLYVASWRLDGVVQIQQKRCGVYTTLALRRDLPAPSPRAWHRMRFEATGERLTLALDNQVVLETTSDTFAWGTAGIRIDGTTLTYLDDWRVY